MKPEYQPDIYLASNSPRRRELLDQIGVRYAWIDSGVEETLQEGESPEVFVLRLALDKARAGHKRLDDEGRRDLPVLGADTIVVLDEQVLGKPRTHQDGIAMLAQLSGSTHRVLTAVALVDGEREATRLSVSQVTFRQLSEQERERYWATGEPNDKAGAYAIQGFAAVFIEQLEGSYSGVMGLPLFETGQLLEEFGIDYQRCW
ncbi:septum formation protein Maf [Alkalilimnicola ehrlichii]|uniref:dTTP/UTP pyrophosphatase n=1 Tax=Alkalilimnicola ehrlichii TaxID=351052 RepID=A0A3E0WXX0_9GAMM|nr:nucleoside triphosphate pyrophosphatase [Alkalilimnicola ehrlichii]RFA30276.1 septum formation protein Maf [Alkalilimnicola ehrlichii]RFA37854.1 septum formation protein Maf [Alkalilimnicola ehrlichii]